MNPLQNGSKDVEEEKSDEKERMDTLGQMDIPWEKEQHPFDPLFLKSDDKIAKYNMHELGQWKALFSLWYTVLSEWDTWKHLVLLTFLCFLTTAIVIATGSEKSVYDNNSVVNRALTLVSFVFAGYITIHINRWDRVRNTTIGILWGGLENLNMESMSLLMAQAPSREEERRLSYRLIRYSRLVMLLTFKSRQADVEVDNLEYLLIPGDDEENMQAVTLAMQHGNTALPGSKTKSDGYNNDGYHVAKPVLLHKPIPLLLEEERKWLVAATPDTRPLMVLTWIEGYFESLFKNGYKPNELALTGVMVNLFNARNGVVSTLGLIEAQLPYPYVHLVYWTIQMVLIALAIETGVILATDTYMMRNGAGQYTPPAGETWPENQQIWYFNNFMQITVSNVIFALFTEGLLKVCDKLSNPLSLEETSFSERVYTSFMFNNIKAMRAGHISYDSISKANAAAAAVKKKQ